MLRLNLMLKDLSFRFGLSVTQISRYLTTWICFLYHHKASSVSVNRVYDMAMYPESRFTLLLQEVTTILKK